MGRHDVEPTDLGVMIPTRISTLAQPSSAAGQERDSPSLPTRSWEAAREAAAAAAAGGGTSTSTLSWMSGMNGTNGNGMTSFVRSATARAMQAAVNDYDEDVLEDDLSRPRGAQRELMSHLRGAESRAVALDEEAADRARVVLLGLRPHDREASDGRVCDPHLRPVQNIAVTFLLGLEPHRSDIRARARLAHCQSTNEFS